MAPAPTDSDAVLALIERALIERTRPSGKRLLIAIAGPPGSGKSTLASEVVERLNAESGSEPRAALLPMDGFHLDNDILMERGLLARKGAPETFDAQGLVELLRRVRAAEADTPYPLFDRALDCALPEAGLLEADTPIVVIEGNYLLLDTPPWQTLAEWFDASVFLAPSIETLEERLVQRWLSFGFSPDAAITRARGNDLKNAATVLDHSRTADLHLTQRDSAP